ncbi:unnamed protein product [Urochloa decumbens]|uniref:DUF4220 domain-containing protein n=1 Tax=Urochloa decumbens TaxID=240449 RepID=A0ABC8WAD1_9POAL
MPQAASSLHEWFIQQYVEYGLELEHKGWIYHRIFFLFVGIVLLCLPSFNFYLVQFGIQYPVSTRPWEQVGLAAILCAIVAAVTYLPRISRRSHWLVLLLPLSCLFFPWLAAALIINIQRVVSTRLREQAENPQVEAEVLAAAIVVLQFLQFILNHERNRRRNHWLVQWGAWAAFYLPVPLAAFAVGVMLQFRRPYWLVAIFFAAGQTDTMATYRLDDDRQSMRRFAKRTLSLAYLILAFLQGVSYQRPMEILSMFFGFLVFSVDLIISSRKTIPSSDICMVAAEHVQAQSTAADTELPSPESCRSSTKKMIPSSDLPAEDVQEAQSAAADSEPDPRRVVVAVGSLGSLREAVSGCTTLQGILDLPSYYSGLKDTCLSSALFIQLLQRYDTPPTQVAADSTSSLNLFFKDLLVEKSTDTMDVCARAFKLVFLSSIPNYPTDEATAEPELGTSVHVLVLIELCQLVGYLTSNWLVVSYMCDRARNSQHTSWMLRILGTLSREAGSQECSWQNELGQYSLIEDFDHTSLKKRLLGRLLGRPQRGTIASPVALSDEIKRWVFDKAVSAESTGLTFLRQKQKELYDDELSWALSQETETHTILIWHIATWFCGKTEEKRARREVLSSSDYVVATKLSSYCAYLVRFVPELLPGHHTVTASIFHKALMEAALKFQGFTGPADTYARVKTWSAEDSSDQGILKLGIKLGRQLIHKDDRHWKIMADFWAEMLLLVAQSDNAIAHIEHVAKGGEFVTHLWAFLYNAGMHKDRAYIKRNKDNGDKSRQAFDGKGKGAAN